MNNNKVVNRDGLRSCIWFSESVFTKIRKEVSTCNSEIPSTLKDTFPILFFDDQDQSLRTKGCTLYNNRIENLLWFKESSRN